MTNPQTIEEVVEEAREKFDLAKASAGKPQSLTDWLRTTLTTIAEKAKVEERERIQELVEKSKLIEAATSPERLALKQQWNRRLDDLLTIINKEK